MIGPILSRLLDRSPLSPSEVRRCFSTLVAPASNDVERAALLVALAGRELTVDELAGFAREMRRRALRFRFAPSDSPIDLCGTGGAPMPSFNVSTVSALVVAAAGVPVVKHGNRSARGICGSSDLLEALGLPVTTSVEFARATYRRHRIAFLHAPLYHPATAAVASVRKLLGVPTVFNRLGPLSNPASVPYQVVGAPNVATAAILARVLPRLGVRRGLALSSAEGCDEFSPREPTSTFAWRGSRGERFTVRPGKLLSLREQAGTWGALPPPAAARESERILSGGLGAARGAVLLTSGAALWVAGRARTHAEGVALARTAIDDGAAAGLLDSLRGLAGPFRSGGR